MSPCSSEVCSLVVARGEFSHAFAINCFPKKRRGQENGLDQLDCLGMGGEGKGSVSAKCGWGGSKFVMSWSRAILEPSINACPGHVLQDALS